MVTSEVKDLAIDDIIYPAIPSSMGYTAQRPNFETPRSTFPCKLALVACPGIQQFAQNSALYLAYSPGESVLH
jgi:hypothetical protein